MKLLFGPKGMFFVFTDCWNVVVFLKEMVENPVWSPRVYR